MRAYEVGSQDGGMTLRMVERAMPVAGAGEVVMRVHATSINARDLWLINGSFAKLDPKRVPLTDNVGTVASIGQGVTGFAIGDRVSANHYIRWLDGPWDESMPFPAHDTGQNRDGFLQEYAVVPAAALVRVSSRLTDIEACTLTVAGLTAWRALAVEARPLPGQTVLTLGTGGVSVFALQIAKMMHARVVITSSSDEKLEAMRQLGADLLVNYRTSTDWPAEVRRLTGGDGVDVVVNTIGYPELENVFRCVADEARTVHIGGTLKQVDLPPLQNLLLRGCTIQGVANGSRRMLEDLHRAIDVNGLRPVVHKVFAFEQALDAIRYMDSQERLGKVVIRVSEAAT